MIAVLDENDAFMRAYVTALKAQTSFKILEIEPRSVFHALSSLAGRIPELLVLDLDLPADCPSESLLRLLHEESLLRNIPVLILAHAMDESHVERLTRYGIRRLLLKPFLPVTLVAQVLDMLPTSGRLVALVDDSHLARSVAARALEGMGYRTLDVEPSSVLAVLAVLKTRRPDLMLLDFIMPSCNPLTLLRAIREDPELASLPVLVQSAHTATEIWETLKRFGVHSVLPKPLQPALLRQEVELCLRGLAKEA